MWATLEALLSRMNNHPYTLCECGGAFVRHETKCPYCGRESKPQGSIKSVEDSLRKEVANLKKRIAELENDRPTLSDVIFVLTNWSIDPEFLINFQHAALRKTLVMAVKYLKEYEQTKTTKT